MVAYIDSQQEAINVAIPPIGYFTFEYRDATGTGNIEQ